MKAASILLSVFMTLAVVSLRAQELAPLDSLGTAQIEIDNAEWQFGDVSQGDIVSHEYTVRNTGTIPLIIQNVFSTCGCTALEWPKEPLAPGAEGKIRIVFDSKDKIGRQNKIITVKSNARTGDFRLLITAMILPKRKN